MMFIDVKIPTDFLHPMVKQQCIKLDPYPRGRSTADTDIHKYWKWHWQYTKKSFPLDLFGVYLYVKTWALYKWLIVKPIFHTHTHTHTDVVVSTVTSQRESWESISGCIPSYYLMSAGPLLPWTGIPAIYQKMNVRRWIYFKFWCFGILKYCKYE